MNCPYCGDSETKVIDTRPADEGASIRRRRECTQCKSRFTTYEKIEEVPLVVVKKNMTRESFNRNKLLGGIIRACEKRPVTMEQMEQLVDWIEKKLQNTLDREVSSEMIGELVMLKLKELDEVAYVRFASVYRQFKDINTFIDELTKLLNEKKRPEQ
ncbi:transcriptional regulator NrdR [Acidaminobacter hydrogenoformans]|uniref:Transcriptional repressor NrdR n=1 Tax=Acidaminobacter hydrogenoformans DSM 2784 TaxID=1120920 RepID=A0A1G5RTD0_9FIRM|nr:transcriptional regulator NrdR [Acidaminobacter hydrogenoformans]SCZ77010.1 transcriptional repressor NrdR [Acidaminobacter hydrogenoformans DSM 2784]